MRPLFELTQLEANAPRPIKPDNLNPRDWEAYFIDLACWKATKAESMMSGVRDERAQ